MVLLYFCDYKELKFSPLTNEFTERCDIRFQESNCKGLLGFLSYIHREGAK